MNKTLLRYYLFAPLCLASAFQALAQQELNWRADFTATAGTGEFAPYHISSLRHGRISSARNAQAEIALWRKMDPEKRIDYEYGVDLIGTHASSVDYQHYIHATGEWAWHSMRPASFRIQQLYAKFKWRSLYVLLGLREHESYLLNNRLSSGDLTLSGNARPMPELSVGIMDFHDIPHTRGALQIQGVFAYGKRMDNKWWREHFNYYNRHLSQGEWYNYKHLYFRTNPTQPFSVTFGAQAAAEFMGTSYHYRKGEIHKVLHHVDGFDAFIKTIIPIADGGESFYTGNHLGSMDIMARYALRSGHQLKAYVSWPWEDGSGIGKLNGWDGLWGLEYKSPVRGPINGVVLEYLNFTNHSGPIQYQPSDWAGNTMGGLASGGDDYYNNGMYNAYAYYGQSIGSPAFMAPIYNIDGYNQYVGNIMRGFHLGLEGSVTPSIDYVFKCSYRKAWGSGYINLPVPIKLTSFMLGADMRVPDVKGLSLRGQVEIDRGTMPGNAFGALMGVRYEGLFNFTGRKGKL